MLFAWTQTSFFLAVAGFLGCLATMGHALCARRPRDRNHAAAPRLSVLVFVLPLVFHAVWLWLALAMPLLAWMLWIGDNNHWFYDWSRAVAAAVAGIVTAAMGYRVFARKARPGYARTQAIAAVGLLLLFGTVQLHECVRRIEGWTPRAAAERILKRIYPILETDRLSLEEEARTETSVTYIVRDEIEPEARITVGRYGRWWWTVAGTSSMVPHPNVWENIDRLWSQNPRLARERLQDVIRLYPNSEASRKAESLLKELDASGKPKAGQ